MRLTAAAVAPPLYGINLPWLCGAYGHDLAENAAHPGWPVDATAADVRLAMERARGLGFGAVRVWLCERGEGVLVDARGPVGVSPRLLGAVTTIYEEAARAELVVYPCLLDANAWLRDGDALLERLAHDGDARMRFSECVAAPLARAMDPARTFALEPMNEPEQMTSEGAGARGVPWATMAHLFSAVRDAVRAEHASLRISASAQHGILPALARAMPFVDLLDLHRYCDDGSLPPLADLGVPAGRAVLAGECGTATEPADCDAEDTISNYVWNAARWGYAACFLWKLEGRHGLIAEDGRVGARATRVRAAMDEVARRLGSGRALDG